MKTFFKWVAGIALVAVFSFVAIVSFNLAGTAGSILSAPGRVIQETLRTENIIGNYEWFHQQIRDVETAERRYNSNKSAVDNFMMSLGDDRSQWKSSDRQEWNRLNSILTGSRNYYNELIQDYNARAAMLNRSIFRDQSLPETLISNIE